jgi:hypothetical protein
LDYHHHVGQFLELLWDCSTTKGITEFLQSDLKLDLLLSFSDDQHVSQIFKGLFVILLYFKLITEFLQLA